MKGNDRADKTGRQSNHHKWFASRKIRSVEELETLPAGTKPRASHHRPPGGERRGKRKRGERAIVHQTTTGTGSKAALGKLLRDGVKDHITGFSKRVDTILN